MPYKLSGLLLLVLLAVVPVMAACAGGGVSGPTEAEPDRSSALAVAPDFTAQEADGGEVSLAGTLEGAENVVLVFYRGVF